MLKIALLLRVLPKASVYPSLTFSLGLWGVVRAVKPFSLFEFLLMLNRFVSHQNHSRFGFTGTVGIFPDARERNFGFSFAITFVAAASGLIAKLLNSIGSV